MLLSRLPRWRSGKESACQCRRPRFDPWVRKIPWSRKWQPTPVFLPGKFHGQRSLVGCSPRDHKESDTTECTPTPMPSLFLKPAPLLSSLSKSFYRTKVLPLKKPRVQLIGFPGAIYLFKNSFNFSFCTGIGSPGGAVVKNQPASAGDTGDAGSIPASGRPPGGGNGNPLQYSRLENPMDKGAWWATAHEVTESLATGHA